MGNTIPKKLRIDAILEAVFEIRFELDALVPPEIVFGRFADFDQWRQFNLARLPTADIPAPMRRADPNLRYLPSIEMTSRDGLISVRAGPQVLAYSRRGAYPGWAKFGSELELAVNRLFNVLPQVQISRLGLRYINALRSDHHGIKSIDDTAIRIFVSDVPLTRSINLNFKSREETNFESMSRIASVDLAEGNIPQHATVVIDIDVYTNPPFSPKSADAVNKWMAEAHDEEKARFFSILGEEATERLRED